MELHILFYFSTFGCTRSSLLLMAFLWLQCTGFFCGGFFCGGAQALKCMCSVVVTCRLSCPEACKIFTDQGSNPCPLLWQAEFYPLYHQGSPLMGL